MTFNHTKNTPYIKTFYKTHSYFATDNLYTQKKLYIVIEIVLCLNYTCHVMKISKLTPLERAAKALFKNTVGNDLGKKKRYLTKYSQTDIFIREKAQVKSVNRRKW